MQGGVGRFRKLTIVKFYQGYIILAQLLATPGHSWTFQCQKLTWTLTYTLGMIFIKSKNLKTRLNEEDSIFVIQNPAVTEILKNKGNQGIRDVYKRNNETLQDFRTHIWNWCQANQVLQGRKIRFK